MALHPISCSLNHLPALLGALWSTNHTVLLHEWFLSCLAPCGASIRSSASGRHTQRGAHPPVRYWRYTQRALLVNQFVFISFWMSVHASFISDSGTLGTLGVRVMLITHWIWGVLAGRAVHDSRLPLPLPELGPTLVSRLGLPPELSLPASCLSWFFTC